MIKFLIVLIFRIALGYVLRPVLKPAVKFCGPIIVAQIKRLK